MEDSQILTALKKLLYVSNIMMFQKNPYPVEIKNRPVIVKAFRKENSQIDETKRIFFMIFSISLNK